MRDRVCIRIEGCLLERLLDRTVEEGVRLSRVERSGTRELRVWADEKNAQRLTALLDRFSLRYEVVDRQGMNACKRAVRRRITVLAGLLLCGWMLAGVSTRYWVIDVDVNARGVDPATLTDLEPVLHEFGIMPGVAKSEVETSTLSARLAAVAPEYTYLAIRTRGVRLTVEAVAGYRAPEVYTATEVSDLVAECDAVVLSVHVMAGRARVQPGDTVSAGRVLIQGEERINATEYRAVRAEGDVLARTWVTAEATEAGRITERTYTGRASVSASLVCREWSVPLWVGETYAVEEVSVERLAIGGLFIPVHVVRTTRTEYRESVISRDAEAVRARAVARATESALAKVPEDAEILRIWTNYDTAKDGSVTARAVVELRRAIAVRTRGG